jgi:haloalkane dehalogenase
MTIGGGLTLRRNYFVERIILTGGWRKKLSDAVMTACRGPFPTPESPRPCTYSCANSLPAERFSLSTLAAVSNRPALIVWGTKDFAFCAAERCRWE